MTDPLLVDLAVYARQLGQISTRTVRRLIDTDAIRSVRVGRRLMVTLESVRAYVDQGNARSHNPDRVGPDVQENSTCRNANNAIKMDSIVGTTRRVGGLRTSTLAARELDGLLAPKTGKRQRPSWPSGGPESTGSAIVTSPRRAPSRT
jgi:hypothetical protein